MRTEPIIELNDVLENGLRPRIDMRLNERFLTDMRNLVPRQSGATSPTDVVYPIVGDPTLSMDWPHPQFLRGDKTLFLALETALYTVEETGFTATQVTTFDAASVGTPKPIASGGGTYCMAAFQSAYFITNGKELIYQIGRHKSGETVVAERAVNAVVNYEGRLFLGGMSGSHFSSQVFLDALKVWRETTMSEIYRSESEVFDTNWLMWTEEGGGYADVPFALLNDLLGYETEPSLEPVWRSRIESGHIGFIPLRHTGAVLEMRQMGDNLVVFGERGISLVRREGQNYIEFAHHHVGLDQRGAVAGQQSLVWIYGDRLWRMSPGQLPEDLNYAEFISTLGATRLVNFDTWEKDYYISDGTTSFVLTPHGLGGNTPLAPSSVFRSRGSTSLLGTAAPVIWSDGVPVPMSDVDFTHPNIVLCKMVPMNQGRAERKRFVNERVSSENMLNHRGALHFRYKNSEPFTRTTQIEGSDEGNLQITTSAVEGAVEFLGTFISLNVFINHWDLQVQTEDKRFSRANS